MNNSLRNPILRTDSYKVSHYTQYPEGATRVSSYIEPRGGKFDEVVTLGLQAFIKEYLMTPITMSDVKEASFFLSDHGFRFNWDGWERIVKKHGGYLPIEISALPEGTVVAPGTMQIQVVNTDPELPWLTSYVETALLRAIWYPSTVATQSREMKKIIYAALKETSDDPDAEIAFKLHDFGARGASSAETAMLGGMAHLVNFMGSDTVEGVMAAREYYGEDMAGFSIPASEHSTMTSWGKDREVEAYRNMLVKNPTGLVACVSDSYDIYNATSNIWGDELKAMVEKREGTLVVRPDSGDPVTLPAEVIIRLMDKFGYTTNSKGYKVLPDCVRVIQGDGMDHDSVKALYQNLKDKNLSASNIAVGMGGGLLQKVDRDTCKYAMKANAIEIDGDWQDVYKDPVTDKGKKSKAGRLAVVMNADIGELTTVRLDKLMGTPLMMANKMQTVYKNGTLLVEESFEDIRARASI